MGKSIRSKTKRFYRAKKREDSVYAAVHAARLNRLHRKLKDITLTDKDGDLDVEEVSEFSDEKDSEVQMQGRYPYLLLGLVDPEDLVVDRVPVRSKATRRGGGGKEQDAMGIFPHFFPDQ